ncbi:MAG: hypothetical protein LBS96_01910 [Oscillospiraceae bacterium]|jgi:hypothetical protein|nr:hypothetical protein [Oscillospiraceae bacterium]
MRRRVAGAIVLLCLLAGLSGCAAEFKLIQPIDALMRPPYEDREQEQLERKLAELQGQEKSAGSQMIFRHPQGGAFRNAVTMRDLNADELEEAVVFYSSYQGLRPENPPLRLAVFVQRKGEWQKIFDTEGDGSTVLSLSFPRLHQGQEGILVNWQKESGEQCFSLYRFGEGQKLEKLLVQQCTALKICDMNGDGTDEVIFLQAAGTETGALPKAMILGYDTANEQVYLLENDQQKQPLDPAFYAFPALEPLPLAGGGNALLLDACRLNAKTAQLEMVTLLLELVEPESGSKSLAVHLADTNTARSLPLPVRDFDGNGSPEVPSEYILPGSLLEDTVNHTAQPLRLVRWNRPVQTETGWALEPLTDAILYLSASHWVQLPAALASGVTVRGTEDGQVRELRFYRLEETGATGGELFRMSVVLATGVPHNTMLTEEGKAAGISLEFLQEPKVDEGGAAFPAATLRRETND